MTFDSIDIAIVVSIVGFILSWVVIEAYAVAHGKATISARMQRLRGTVFSVLAVGGVVALLVHFFG